MIEVLKHEHADRWYDIGVGKITDFNEVKAVD